MGKYKLYKPNLKCTCIKTGLCTCGKKCDCLCKKNSKKLIMNGGSCGCGMNGGSCGCGMNGGFSKYFNTKENKKVKGNFGCCGKLCGGNCSYSCDVKDY